MKRNKTNSSDHIIRAPVLSDRGNWETLWKGYLNFYGSAPPKSHTDVLWARIHDPQHPICCLVAERTKDSHLIGFAHFFPHSDTAEIRMVCYLQDLFVAENARLNGVGASLIQHVKECSDRKGWVFVYWQTKHDNLAARKLYDHLTGGTNGFVTYRLGQRSK